MEMEVEKYGDKTVVIMKEDRLDAAMAVRFKDELKTVVEGGADHMILDMSSVGFMDSSGLGAIVAHMKFMGTDRVFEISGLTPTVEKVFKLTRMDNVFRIYENVGQALDDDTKQAV